MAIQQLTLGVGASKKTYLDDVFSQDAYIGNATTRDIVNGVDLTKGGLVWFKDRSADNTSHYLFDSTHLPQTSSPFYSYAHYTNSNALKGASANALKSFNNNGFSIYTGGLNTNTNKQIAWSFQKAPGFFDCVKYTGTGSSVLTLSHDLGSVPAMILIKRLDGSAGDWIVYHRSTGISNYLKLNSADGAADDTGDYLFNNVAPTATHFTVGAGHDHVNANTNTYVAYLFAGGESTAATARSVDFDGTGDALVSNTSTDYVVGTNDFTVEFWIKMHYNFGGAQVIFDQNKSSSNATTPFQIYGESQNIHFGTSSSHINKKITSQHWTHVAVARSSGTTTMYINGMSAGTYSDSNNYDSNQITIGGAGENTATQNMSAWLSNVRLVVGTAVYTSSFRPPTEPLTNITNTKFLACQNSTTTGCTVGTIQAADGNPSASTDSPFDDPAAFTFGDSKEGIIKCGSYLGNGSSTGPEINLGWEPQWLLIKNTVDAEGWALFDCMRGVVTGGNDSRLWPNGEGDESDNQHYLDITSTGFKITYGNNSVNPDGDKVIYCAIRRPDGYVGKPPELGTSVFNIANYDSTAPAFNANFAVDFAMFRRTNSSYDWRTSARLIQTKYLKTNNTDTDSTENDYVFDYNDGWNKQTGYANNEVSWMWSRGAGFDVVTYAGVASTYSASGVGSISVPHSLNAVPEMIWVKNRTYEDANGWAVYHKGLNGGTNPEQYRMRLQDTNAEDDNVGAWQDTAPTSTHFTLGTDRMVNQSPNNYLAILFTSVNGISKVGSYVGVSGNGNATINLGFTPRLFICKRVDSAANWYIWDSIRGLGSSGTEKPFFLNSNVAEGNAYNYLDTTSSGVTLYGGIDSAFLGNDPSNHKYIYYAHA